MSINKKTGFTLIELLVVISVIGLLVGIATFALRQAQGAARDGKRKADLETIATGLELYRAACNAYPASGAFLSGTLSGSGSPPNCTGNYITGVPQDPQPGRTYSYVVGGGGSSYVLCASLEDGSAGVSGCGSCGTTCNYKISRP